MKSITREELYALVWAKPLNTLAAKLGLSDVGLAKICTRLGVPRPPQGHWNRVAHVRIMDAPGLPPLADGQERAVSLRERSTAPSRLAPQPRPAVPIVPVRDSLAGAHPVVTAISGLLKRQEPDRDGIVTVYCDGQSRLRTTLAQKDRVLRILDALLRALVARGHAVELRHAGTHQHGMRVVVSDKQDALRVSIIERLVRSDHVLTAEEKASAARTGHSWAPKYDHRPSGRLALELLKVDYSRALSKWEDKGDHLLESVLGEVVLRVEAKFAELRAERGHREEERRTRAAQEKIRAREKELREYRELLTEDLVTMATRWEQAARIRAFLDAASPALSAVDAADPAGRAAWLAWGRSYADQLDPIRSPHLLAKRLEPPSSEYD